METLPPWSPISNKIGSASTQGLIWTKDWNWASARWVSKLIGYDFLVEYRNGKENLVANALSRQNEEQVVLAVISFPTSIWIEEYIGEAIMLSHRYWFVDLELPRTPTLGKICGNCNSFTPTWLTPYHEGYGASALQSRPLKEGRL